MKKYLIFICLLLVISSCRRIDYDDLNYYGKYTHDPSLLKINGFYYSDDISSDTSVYYYILFYMDGIYRNHGNTTKNFEEIEKRFNTYAEPNYIRKWGAYIIENDIIKTQVYYGEGDIFYFHWTIQEKHGEIINDTTIHFYKKTYRGKTTEIDQTFYFHACTNCKIDSTLSWTHEEFGD